MEPSEVSPAAHAAASVQHTHRQHGLSSVSVQAPVQTHHQMVHTASRQLSAPLLPMEHSLLSQATAKQSVLTFLLQHGLNVALQCAILHRQASIAPATTSARPGTATVLKLSLLFPRLA
jgi:hypothetical protein